MAEAVAYIGEGRLDDARTICERLLEGDGDNIDAIYAMGWIAFCQDDQEAALARFRRVIELDPGHARAHNNIATILMTGGDNAGAAGHLEAAVDAAPEFAEAHGNLGAVRLTQREPNAARAAFERAAELIPEDPSILSNLATVKLQLGEVDEAIADYQKVVVLDPKLAEAHNNLGQALRRKGRLEEAAESFRRAVASRPDYADAQANLGIALLGLGRLEEAVISFRKALALKPDLVDLYSKLIFNLKFMEGSSSAEIKAEASKFGDMVGAKAQPFADWNLRRDPAKRLRVGMVSADFRDHVVGRYLESFLGHFDRSQVELAAYNNSPSADETTARLKLQFPIWRDVVELDDRSLARLIHEDAVDILIDLSGHSADNRLPMFAYKPAPVQATWLGLFATTGVPGMDYIIADPYLAPGNESQFFTEEVWPLAETWFCLSPPVDAPEPAPLPALENGYVTFGSFNKLFKMTDTVIALWARVMDAVPGSKLFLKTKLLHQDQTRQNTLARFADHGIGAERLVLEEISPTPSYFAAYNRVDIALDPFPYHGATTSLDGLWMGVPMVTRRGDRVGTHLGESIAHNAGLADWIADDDEDYVAKAIARSSNLPELAALRAGLRDRVLASSLYDGQGFARHFEDALRGMWRRACES